MVAWFMSFGFCCHWGLSWAQRSFDFCIHLGWLLYSGGAQRLFTLLFWSHTLPSITGVDVECWVWGGGVYLESGGREVILEWNKLLLLNKLS